MDPKDKRTATDANEVIRDYYGEQPISEAEGFPDLIEPVSGTPTRDSASQDKHTMELNAGDIDASSQDLDIGTEAPGGSNPTPDQDLVDEIGTAVGITYHDREPLSTGEKEEQRDIDRWELDPASADDYQERMADEATARKATPPTASKKPSRTGPHMNVNQEDSMPERETKRRARKAKQTGKAATTQAGAFVAEEMRHKKQGKHPVKSKKQAIAIGLSKARQAGVDVPRKGGSKSKHTSQKSKSKRTRRHTD